MVASPPGTSFFGTRLMAGFGGLSTEPPLLLLVLKGFWTWGLSLPFECSSLLIRRSLMITLVAFSGIGNCSSGITLLHNINLCSLVFGTILRWIPLMTWECSYLVWISLWLVAIGCHWVPSVAILAAGVGVVKAPWHGHHAQYISAS